MSEMIDISKLKTWDKPHKVYILSKYGVFVKRDDLEKLLEPSHNSDYAKCCCCIQNQYLISVFDWSFCPKCGNPL